MGSYTLRGDTTPVRDPSIARQGATYYSFGTDPAAPSYSGHLPIRCSADEVNWSACGYVFAQLPAWVAQAVPATNQLWAPDISYFGGVYHLYYCASTLLSQVSAIGEATSPTLDQSSPAYGWTDQGEVLASSTGDDFNALDPTILTDTDGRVWLTYGSFWSGIKQRAVDPSSGKLSQTDAAVYSLAARPSVPDHAIEGASLVHHGSYYYLFASTGHCCEADDTQDDYEQVVGRGPSPHGPFIDTNGIDMMQGGGNVLLQGNAVWNAPGGGTAYLDSSHGDSLLVFHAANLDEGGAAHLWIKTIDWSNDWPTLQ